MRFFSRYGGAALGALVLAGILSVEGVPPSAEAAARKPRRSPARSRAPRPAPVRFVPALLELGPGEEITLEIRMSNTYKRPTIGRLDLHPTGGLVFSQARWDGPLPAWGAKHFVKVKAPAGAKTGKYTLKTR